MAHVFFGVAAGDFLVHRQARRQRFFFGVRAGQYLVNHTRCRCNGLRGGVFRHASFQHFHHARAPFSGGRLVFYVSVDAIQQALSAQFRELIVKIFAGLAEEFVRGIAKAKDGKRGAIEFWRFFREQEFMQRDRFFRRFALALRGSNHNNQFF
ncbi:hypothetical protein D3C72_853540 [compost metagenome]